MSAALDALTINQTFSDCSHLKYRQVFRIQDILLKDLQSSGKNVFSVVKRKKRKLSRRPAIVRNV